MSEAIAVSLAAVYIYIYIYIYIYERFIKNNQKIKYIIKTTISLR